MRRTHWICTLQSYFFIHNYLQIFQIWKGRMSFPGKLRGQKCVIFCFSQMFRKKKIFQGSDFMVLLVTLLLGAAGRIGNLLTDHYGGG
ncbi:MAG: prolipoprotein diacylglyceryl transferase family protein [Candidatus Dasytiphilus stammeri]